VTQTGLEGGIVIHRVEPDRGAIALVLALVQIASIAVVVVVEVEPELPGPVGLEPEPALEELGRNAVLDLHLRRQAVPADLDQLVLARNRVAAAASAGSGRALVVPAPAGR